MKERLDILLVKKGYFDSREKAKRAVMAGLVLIDELCFDKPGTSVDVDSDIRIKGDSCPYVSRGGLKLEKSVNLWELKLNGFVCMDIGASTGGFTDCMLKNGASKVYALDVGTNQLAYSLRSDERAVVMERTNIRDIDPLSFEKLDFISVDVSFISLKHVFPKVSELLKPNGKTVALVKPQFEAGREKVGKGGIVRERAVHEEVIRNVFSYAEAYGLYPEGLDFSPITGAKGNIEYLLLLGKDERLRISDEMIKKVVDYSHSEFENK